ncbi:hypothetical protein [Flindersiella endophytica]
MSDDGSRSNPWHWHEYDVGLVGEVARACAGALVAFLIGLGCAFVLILGVGLLAEEALLGDPGVEEAIDHLSRMSVGVLAALASVAWGASAVASYVREVATSKALVRAAARGASRYEVPSPQQVESVTREPAEQLIFFAWATAAVTGLVGVIGLLVMLFDRADSESLLIFSIVTGYALVMLLVGLAARKWFTAAHERRKARIAAHWSVEDEGKAWRPAHQASRGDAGKKKLFGSSIGDRYIYGAAVLAGVGFVALTGALGMRCARVPGGGTTECDETTYSSFVEDILAWGFWIFAVLLALAMLLAVVGVLLDWRRRRSERADLRASLADPRSGRPAEDLLAYHARRRTHPLALVGAAMSGAGLVFSASSYLLGQGMGLGSQDVFAAYRTESLIALIISVSVFVAALLGSGIVNVRGRELRNALMRRWPTLPSWSAGNKGVVLRAKRGPALHGSRHVKVGPHANSDQR